MNEQKGAVSQLSKDVRMAREIAREVKKQGGHTYYVGGYVRDLQLSIPNKDIDIEVHGITPEQLRNILDKLGTVLTIGQSFGILNLKGYDLDIAQPRMEKNSGRGHKDFEISVDPFIGVEKAAKRRDFTMNALMQDVLTGELIDPFGGLQDLQNGIIRHVDDNSFIEDPLRVLRACQFAARFQFDVAPETLELCKRIDISSLPKERIAMELDKALLKARRPSVFFESLQNMEHMEWFPEVEALKGVPQNPIYHPEGDVYIHTMMTLDAAAKLRSQAEYPKYFMIAALCHDFGKVVATTTENGVHAINHETAGLSCIRKFLSRIYNENAMTAYVTNLTEHHMKTHLTYQNQSRVRKTNELFDSVKCVNDLILLTRADSLGRTGVDYATVDKEEAWLRERAKMYMDRLKEPTFTAKDLLELGVKPSPAFKEILDKTHHLHLCGVEKEHVLKQILPQVKGEAAEIVREAIRVQEARRQEDVLIRNQPANDIDEQEQEYDLELE